MKEKVGQVDMVVELFRQAEEQGVFLLSEKSEACSSGGLRRFLSQIQGHLLELDLENTELRRSRAELESEQAHYFDLFDQAPLGYCILSNTGQVLEANLTLTRMLGVPRGMFVDMPLAHLVLPDDLGIYYRHRKAAKNSEAAQQCELRMRRSDGNVFWASLKAAETCGVDGESVCRVMVDDITERKRLETSLIHSKEAAVMANRAKSEFLARMSHELRTPLTAILGFSEVLEDCTFGALNEKQSKYVSNVLAAGRHLLSLINDVLDLSKVEAGKMDLELAPVAVTPLLQDSLMLVQEEADRKGLRLGCNAQPDMKITADERKLKQILSNLLSNAVKFTPDGGSVQVEARISGNAPVGDNWPPECLRDRLPGSAPETIVDAPHINHTRWLEISVADTGVGIEPEDHHKLFRLFEQLESGTGQRHHGTGLGLALCRSLVELHDGGIWAESEGEGKGCTFRFVLPVGDTGAPQKEAR